MKQVTITCNLCTCTISHSPRRGGFGLSMNGDGGWTIDWKEPMENSPIHLCYRCLSTIASLKVCGQGFESCGGGPKCGSDHK